jgi:hypothetical protein
LGESGDDWTRYERARARRCSGGIALITHASGTRPIARVRMTRNRRLVNPSCSEPPLPLTCSAGARRFYDAAGPSESTHRQAPRALGTRLVGILRGWLEQGSTCCEANAGPSRLRPPLGFFLPPDA